MSATTIDALPVRERVPIEAAFGSGWHGLCRHFLQMAATIVVSGFVLCLPLSMLFWGQDLVWHYPVLQLLLLTYTVTVFSAITLGFYKMGLTFKREKHFDLDTFLSAGSGVLNYLCMTVLRNMLIGFGYLLLFFPGIYFGLRLGQAEFFIVDRGMGPIESLDASWRATTGASLMLLLMQVLTGFILFVGSCLFGFGLLPAMMMVLVAKAYLYDNLVATCPVPLPLKALPESTANGEHEIAAASDSGSTGGDIEISPAGDTADENSSSPRSSQ